MAVLTLSRAVHTFLRRVHTQAGETGGAGNAPQPAVLFKSIVLGGTISKKVWTPRAYYYY